MTPEDRQNKKAFIRLYKENNPNASDPPEDFPYEIDLELFQKIDFNEFSYREISFVIWYSYSGNPTWSAKRAGYEQPVKAINGLLSKSSIKKAITTINEHLMSAAIADANELRRFWTEVTRSEETSFQHRIKCSELLGKQYGIFSEKLIIEGNHSVKHEVSINQFAAPPTASELEHNPNMKIEAVQNLERQAKALGLLVVPSENVIEAEPTPSAPDDVSDIIL